MFPVAHLGMPANRWRTSTHSGQNGDCVEVLAAQGGVFARDTKDRDGPVLKVSAPAWMAFAASLKT